MAELSGPRRLLFISNGHGEDSIAAAIIRRLPQGVTAEAYPMIGDGLAFNAVCRVVGPRAHLASQGWRNVKGSLSRDLVTGGLSAVLPGLDFCRRVRGYYDRVIVVGDMTGVVACRLTGHTDIVYLDVYKTGYGRLYWTVERSIIAHSAATVFCRSDRLAAPLRATGVDARCVGNVMMDTISYGDYDVAARRTRPQAVALLPGSRHLAVESFALQIEALRFILPEQRPDIFLALAGSVSLEQLARGAGLDMRGPMTGEAGDGGTLSGGGLVVHVARGSAGNLIEAADLVLSQAGTATIQALGLGKPALTFINPRDRRSRVRDETALFGEARLVLPPNADAIAMAVQRLLADGKELLRLGAIGRERIGAPGAIDEIIAAIVPQASPAKPLAEAVEA